MRINNNLLLLTSSIFFFCMSPNLMAAGKCSTVRTESTFELINAPAQEMLNSRNSTAINCVILKDFIARSKLKSNAQSTASASSPQLQAQPTSGAYVPKTKDDNTPWRFDMNQNGKRMTSVEFDAWMKAKGIRVATGKPGAESSSAPEDCKSTKEKAC